MIRGTTVLGGLVVAAACATEPVPLSTDATSESSGWTIEKQVGARATGAYMEDRHLEGVSGPWGSEFLFLERDAQGGWHPTDRTDVSQLGVEALWMNPRTKQIGLATTGTSMNSADTEKNVCDHGETGDRSVAGYSLCNSEITRVPPSIDFMLAPLEAVLGTDFRTYALDVELVREALAGHDVDELYQLASARTAAFFESDAAEIGAGVERLEAASAGMDEYFAEQERLQQEWFDRLQPGDRVACGLVVEKREAMAQIEFDIRYDRGPRWIRSDVLAERSNFSTRDELEDHCYGL